MILLADSSDPYTSIKTSVDSEEIYGPIFGYTLNRGHTDKRSSLQLNYSMPYLTHQRDRNRAANRYARNWE